MIFLLILFAVTPPVDACAALADARLLAAVSKAAPGYRWPTAADVSEDDAKYLGQPCPVVGAGDFDGDGAADRAALLFPIRATQQDGVLVAALRRGDQWHVNVLFRGKGLNFVSTGPPGSYNYFEAAVTRPSEAGEVLAITAHTDVIITGTLESSEVVYVRTKRGWVHVWTAD